MRHRRRPIARWIGRVAVTAEDPERPPDALAVSPTRVAVPD